ncbi:phosphotransferase [Saccharopolyspora pogona]|uniref:phosphotransferase n=1 Tax=Saccharopolyspora pogona TaxID=333966 RepID=UPI0016871F79|nr:phosphotransferase [Saccharopolyspora pogona]
MTTDTTTSELAQHIATGYALGKPTATRLISTGFEDTNLDLTTRRQQVVAKVFAPSRARWAHRTAEIIQRARAAGGRHPRLHHDTAGQLVHHLPGGRTCLVMDRIDGADYYQLGRPPTTAELGDLADQVVLVHSLDLELDPVSDPWQITQLVPLAHTLHDVLDAEQRRLVDTAITATTAVRRDLLPVTVIHGDLTKGNVLVDHDGRIVMIDFGVAHTAPRVQELAVVAANLCHGSPTPLPQRAEHLAALYSPRAASPLTTCEHAALAAYTGAAAAMEMLGALAEWHHGNRGSEVAYLIDLGLAGLRETR